MSYSLSMTQAMAIALYISVKMEEGHFEYLSTKFISEKLGIPAPSVTKILKQFHSSGLIETKEGAGGGILLKKNSKEVTLQDIFLAMENQKPLFKEASLSLPNAKAESIMSRLLEALSFAESDMKASLEKTTLYDLIKDDLSNSQSK